MMKSEWRNGGIKPVVTREKGRREENIRKKKEHEGRQEAEGD